MNSEATKTNPSPDGTNPKEVFKVDDPSITREPGEGNDLALSKPLAEKMGRSSHTSVIGALSSVGGEKEQMVIHPSNISDDQDTLKLGDSQSPPLTLSLGHNVPFFNNDAQVGGPKGTLHPIADRESSDDEDLRVFQVFGETGSEVSDIQIPQDSTDHRILENQSRMAQKMKDEEVPSKVNYLIPRSKKTISSQKEAGTVKTYVGEGIQRQSKLTLPPTLRGREYEKLPGGAEPHDKNTYQREDGWTNTQAEPRRRHESEGPSRQNYEKTNFDERAQDLWKESNEIYDRRQDRWLHEPRERERNRKTRTFIR